jgi:acyl-phosphate glycerol 3-phosphate acyltransferase
MSFVILLTLVWAGAYLEGAIPFGYLVARGRGVDIFKLGSGNIGATNVGRVLGKKFGILVFLLDFAKGALPVAAALSIKKALPAEALVEHGWLEVGAGLAAFVGHLFPVYLGFRGGKGVATGAGVVAVLLPIPTLGAVLAWVTVAAATNHVSLASLAAAAVLCGLQLVRAGDAADPRTLFCLLAGGLVLVKHRANIGRLMKGTENKISWGHPLRKVVHLLALGLWFGGGVFFTFVVTPTLFSEFEALGTKEERPAWFPLAPSYARTEAEIHGPKEQGARAAGYAVGGLFHPYFVLQALCGFIATWTALAWSRENRGVNVHRWRAALLLLALITALAGWPLERHVSELRGPRTQAIEAYLSEEAPSATAALDRLKDARAEFGRWHVCSLMLNFVTVILVTGGMALASALPGNSLPPSPPGQLNNQG